MERFADLLAQARQAFDIGALGRAESLARQILGARPDNPQACYLLGLVCQRQGRWEEALGYLQKVIRVRPDSADVHNALGCVLQDQGKLEAAAEAFRQALRLRPNSVAAHNNLGNVLLALDKRQEAADCYGAVLRLQPECAAAHYALGKIWQELGRLPQAALCYRRALRFDPGLAAAHNGLGMTYIHDGQREAALACFQEALRLEPNHPLAHANLGTFLLEEGHREEASAHFKEALRRDPNCVPAWTAVTQFGLFPLSDADLAQVHALLAYPGLAPAQACQLHFGLGNWHDRAGRWEEAFAHFAQANTLRRGLLLAASMAFDAAAHRQRVDQIIATCDAAYFRRVRGFGRDTQRPIFIVGMPRAGTTLVEQILGSHPDVFAAGELEVMNDLTRTVSSRLGASEGYPACLARLDAGTAGLLADWYLGQLARRNSSAPRVTDKMALSFEHLGLIAALFPRAHIIHCRRDPMDVCLSCYFNDFRGISFVYDFEDLGNYYVEYERLMAHWRSVLPLSMLEVRYEELVNEPEEVSRRLVSFCGLSWDDRCRDYYRSKWPVRTSSLVQVRQPIYQSSVGRWQHYAPHLGPLRDILQRASKAKQRPPATSAKKGPAVDPEASRGARHQAWMGDALLREGYPEQAARVYLDALGQDPACVPALVAVAWHGLFPLTEHELSRMQTLLADPGVPPGDAARLHFGLAHVHERAGDYDRAFEHFSRANSLRRGVFRDAGKIFDATWFKTWIDQIITHCDADYFKQIKGQGHDTQRPVFIVGMPRSGCTAAEQLLTCHPAVHAGGELLEIGRLMAGLRQGLPAGELYPKRERLDAALCGALADRYLQRMERLSATAARVTDRTPNNFQFLGLIAALFPQARVIHCQRNPVDVCFSCYIQDFTEWTLNLDEVAFFYREYERLMAHWKSVLPLPVLEVSYEELTTDPEAASRRMVSFCGLEWDDRCLNSSASLQAASQSPVGRWRPYAAHMQPLLKALGQLSREGI
jgi:tetratricopeptide (TPR) repeat protein